MSKTSRRLRRELVKAKAANRLLQTRGQSPETASEVKSNNHRQIEGNPIDYRKLLNSPIILAIIGTVAFAMAGFIQLYSHTMAIWVCFLALIIYGQALRVALKDHGIRSVFYNGALWMTFFIALMVCCILQIIEIKKSYNKEPTMAEVGNGIAEIENLLTNGKTGPLSDSLKQIQEISKKLIEARDATQPRIVTSDQRRNFITLLADSHSSKISIPVIVGNNDTETESFAEQIREMLNAAGFGAEAPQSLPAPSQIEIFVTNQAVGIIPPYMQVDEQSIVSIPGVFPRAANQIGKAPIKNPEVFAVVSRPDILTSKTNPPFTASFMIFSATKNNPNGGELLAYHPTNDPNEIIIGICNALVKEGISVGFLPANGKLPLGLFIPRKI